MSETRQLEQAISFEEYLEGEQLAEQKHELVAGRVYAMAGATAAHNRLSLNAASLLDSHLDGSPCTPFVADMKLRVRLGADDHVYYPDVFVTCDPSDDHELYKERPDTIIEVLSNSTESTDRREKLGAYTQIPSLNNYLLVAQKVMEVTLYRRETGWRAEVFTKPEEQVPLKSLDFSLSLEKLYRRIVFPNIDPLTGIETYPELT
ncbi:MAG: Uma2 family endonuclease [Verrucomicrobiales bacterium]